MGKAAGWLPARGGGRKGLVARRDHVPASPRASLGMDARETGMLEPSAPSRGKRRIQELFPSSFAAPSRGHS